MSIQRVLIVDDDEDVRNVTDMAVRHIGKWQTVLAASGEEALEKARSEQPDVILLDVMMPGLDGPSTLAKLRKDPATLAIPVIFLTAKAQPHEISHFMALGAHGVIAKPFQVQTLPAEIVRIVEGR